MKVHFSNYAKDDIAEIRVYTKETHGLAQAKRYVKLLLGGIKLLEKNPRIGYTVEGFDEVYRSYQVSHHRVFYRIAETRIHVIAVLHQSQEPDRHLMQRENS